MKPPRSILDPAFRYTPSHETDLRKLFEKVRKEMDKAAEHYVIQPANVRPLLTQTGKAQA